MSAHGTRSRYVAGCRCEPCAAANRKYASLRERYGWADQVAARWVDPCHAYAHILWLRTQGVGLRMISDQSGVARSTLAQLARRERISADTQARILAVLPTPSRVDGTGTRRRLQALIAIGHTGASLADRIGWSRTNIWNLILGDGLVSARTAAKVTSVYDQLWNQPGPSTRARNLAAKRGWPPPLAWDDIEDPDAHPLDVTRRSDKRSPQDWLEDYQDTWDHHGGNIELAAERLGTSSRHLYRMLRQSGLSA